MAIAEETLAEFLSKATGTAVDWVQMPGMKVKYVFVVTLCCDNVCTGEERLTESFFFCVSSAWSGFGWHFCHFTKMQWRGSSSLWSCQFRTYEG